MTEWVEADLLSPATVEKLNISLHSLQEPCRWLFGMARTLTWYFALLLRRSMSIFRMTWSDEETFWYCGQTGTNCEQQLNCRREERSHISQTILLCCCSCSRCAAGRADCLLSGNLCGTECGYKWKPGWTPGWMSRSTPEDFSVWLQGHNRGPEDDDEGDSDRHVVMPTTEAAVCHRVTEHESVGEYQWLRTGRTC